LQGGAMLSEAKQASRGREYLRAKRVSNS